MTCALSPPEISIVAENFPVAVAAFVGAAAAFALQWAKEHRDNVHREIAAGNGALFALFDQLETLVRIRDDHLEELRKDEDRHLELPPIYPRPSALTIDSERLLFLLRETSSRPGILKAILDAERASLAASEMLEARLEYFLSEVQPRMDALPPTAWAEEEFPVAEVERVLGPRVCLSVSKMTNNVYGAVDDAIELNLNAGRILRDFLIAEFPGFAFIRLELRKVARKKPGEPQ